ncbi:Alpha-(1 6)-fucosyltransferase [Paragonimus kellicotti]|nr:Alpha-(1 6)-fucosyltransferase [Paragonimus kellicotti]
MSIRLTISQEWAGDTHNKQQVQSSITRRVFIATDDPSVLDEARKYFPQYTFEGDSERARSADVSRRTQADSITGIALDILVLSRTDYLVCTFSSQVCRVAYELMQTRHAELGDASGLAWSLDSIYYFGGQQSNPYKMIIADETTGSKPGDLFHVDGNSWNGYADLHSIPNNTKVKLPAYKVYPRVLTVEITEIMPV